MSLDDLYHHDMDGKRIPHSVNAGPQITCAQCQMLRCGADFVHIDGAGEHELTVCCYCASKNYAESRDEEKLQERDVRVSKSISYGLQYKRDLAEQMRRDAAELEKQARRIESAVLAGRWWELEGLLEQDDIESLCQCEPCDRSDLLKEIV